MKYNGVSLDLAIDILLPEMVLLKEAGVTFNRPTMIGMVANQYFLKKTGSDLKNQLCYHVVQEAARDLKKIGWINFGDESLELELTLYLPLSGEKF